MHISRMQEKLLLLPWIAITAVRSGWVTPLSAKEGDSVLE